MKKEEEELVRVSAALAGSAPQLWERFQQAILNRAWNASAECVNSPPCADTHVHQGKAREGFALAKLFAECRVTADELSTRDSKVKT